jgi:hypothetical protein
MIGQRNTGLAEIDLLDRPATATLEACGGSFRPHLSRDLRPKYGLHLAAHRAHQPLKGASMAGVGFSRRAPVC